MPRPIAGYHRYQKENRPRKNDRCAERSKKEPNRHFENVCRGFPFIYNFFSRSAQLVSFLSNRQSGAVGMPNVIVGAWYFWQKDVENGYYMKSPDYYLRQQFQKFIYRLNQPFLRIDQSAFTNVSIFDRPYLKCHLTLTR